MELKVFTTFITVMIIYRLIEMRLSKRNERILSAQFPKIVNHSLKEKKFMMGIHVLWFISLMTEFIYSEQMTISGSWLFLCIFFIFIAFVLRGLSMKELGIYWTIPILEIERGVNVRTGIYKYIKHPNYLAVVFEFIFIPLLFKCYITLTTFLMIKLIFLWKRIKLENKILAQR
ncbi:MAG: hypothetical protein JNM93_04785 [Bacteriovoracaceae bacterium]|nr:hypothetical protein [Bacteriovoracaceae bacterium]